MEYQGCTVLLVDDEAAVLRALNRTLRPLGCEVVCCESPLQAIGLLEQQPVDLVISDMRMPEMGGEVFLEAVAQRWPDTERMVLTGYADVTASIEAVNRGGISRFMLKPWQDEEVVRLVAAALSLSQLRRQNEQLQLTTQQQNRELAELNQSLEAKVQARTAQLKVVNTELKNSYRSVVRMFSTLAARRLGVVVTADNQRLNQIMLKVAQACGIEGKALKQLFYAWQLRHIGKLSFNDALLMKPYVTLTPEQQRQFHTHPLLAQAATMLVKPLYPTGAIIRQHKEYLDGSGYPLGLKGEQIAFSARILCVVSDYVELIRGQYQARQYSTDEALSYLKGYASERYEAVVVETLEQTINELAQQGSALRDQLVSSQELVVGMRLSRDLINHDGVLLLSAGQRLDATLIERIHELELNFIETLQLYVDQH